MKKYIIIAILALAPLGVSAQTTSGQFTVSTTSKAFVSIDSINQWANLMPEIVVPSYFIDAQINTPSGKTIDVQKFTDSTGTCYYSEVEQTGQISVNCIN